MSKRSSLFDILRRSSASSEDPEAMQKKAEEITKQYEDAETKKDDVDGERERDEGEQDLNGDNFHEVKSFDDSPLSDDEKRMIQDFYDSEIVKAILADETLKNTKYGKLAEAKDERIALKFIRCKHGKLEKALACFDATVRWRASKDVDNALNWGFSKVEYAKTHYPHGFSGYDKKGRPLYVERVGLLDVKKLTKEIPVDDYARYHIVHWEYVHQVLFKKATEMKGRPVDELVTIVDLKGLGTAQFHPAVGDFLKRITKVDDEFYPEAGVVLIVNMPWIFKAAWKIISPWVSSRAKEKVKIIKGNEKDELLKYIDEEYLPDYLGGKAQWQGLPEETNYVKLLKGDIKAGDIKL